MCATLVSDAANGVLGAATRGRKERKVKGGKPPEATSSDDTSASSFIVKSGTAGSADFTMNLSGAVGRLALIIDEAANTVPAASNSSKHFDGFSGVSSSAAREIKSARQERREHADEGGKRHFSVGKDPVTLSK